MKTIGQMLQEKRVADGLSLEQVEKETKIRKKFLLAIESDNYASIPSQAYAKGFVKNYSEYLGFNSRTMMAFFRRQTAEAPKSSILPKGVAEPLNRSRITLTPSRFLVIVVVILLSAFLLYFGSQYRKLQIPPAVSLESPKQNLVTSDNRVDVIGTTDPDATVTINSIGVLVRSDGKFFDQVQLFPGNNTVTVMVTSRYGKTTNITRTVKEVDAK